MIKFILERHVNLYQTNHRRNYSHLQLGAINQPINTVSPSEAIAKYKQCDEQIQQLAKRLSVLKQQQRKMESKTIKNNHKLQHYQRIRQQINLQRKRSEQYRKELAKEMQLTRSIINNQRQMQAKKLQQTKRQMYFQRWQNYLDERQHYKNQMNATNLHFQSELINKRKKKLQIQRQQQKQRDKVQQYYMKKKDQIRLNNLSQKTKINSMTDSKLDQLDSLTHIESILLSRQARSRMSSEQSTNRLNKISPIPKINTNKRDKAHNSKTNSPYDIYIV